MPTVVFPFFHATVLRQQFIDHLQQLRQVGGVTAQEHDALINLVAVDHDPRLGRYDRFVPAPGQVLDAYLHGALALALPDAAPVYLFTALAGIKRYASHGQLRQALADQGIDTEGLALELIERRPFRAQMEHYLQHRASNLALTAEALAALPVLDRQLSSAQGEPTAALAALQAFWEKGPEVNGRLAQIKQAYCAGFYQILLMARQSPVPLFAMALLQAAPYAENVRWARLMLQWDGEEVPLAGTLVWFFNDQPQRCVFTPHSGVAWYSDEQALLHAQANSPLAPINIPTTQRARWHQGEPPRLVLAPLAADPFAQAIEDICAAQRADVYDALLSHGQRPAEEVMIEAENALDIRLRLDRRLSALDPTARWVNLSAAELAAVPDPLIPDNEAEVIALLEQVRESRRDIGLAQPGVQQVIDGLLRPWLVVFDEALAPQQVRVSFDHEQLLYTVSLGDLLIERFTGRLSGPLPRTATVQWESRDPAAGLDVEGLEFWLDRAIPTFAERYQAHLDRLYHHGQRVNGRWVDATSMMERALEWVLRADLALAVRDGWLPTPALGLLQAALEGSTSVQAFGIDLELNEEQAAVRLADVAVLRLQPALSEGNDNGVVLFWSAALGIQTALNLEELGELIIAKLKRPGVDNPYLGLLPRVDGAMLEVLYDQHTPVTMKASYWPMQGGLLHRLHKSAHGRRLQQCLEALELVRLGRFGARITSVLLDEVAIDDSLAPAVSRLAAAWADRQAERVLPAWVLKASTQDQHRFIHYLRECVQVASPSQDYLEGMPGLEAFAGQEVRRRLLDDGFSASLDPDRVRIISRAYIPAPVAIGNLPSAIPAAVSQHTQSLTEAVLQPTAWLRETMILSLDDGSPLPSGLTPLYVRQMVRSLDCGGHYRRLLESTLSRDSPTHGLRRTRFTEQMRRQMLMTAFALKLQGVLGEVAFAMIERVAQAPDAQARRDAGIEGAALSLLQLRAAPGLGVDTCQGVYVLRNPAGSGPVVVFMLYSRQAAFVEYTSSEAFERALHSDEGLQDALIERLDPSRRPIYAAGGLARPHLNRFFPEAVTDLVSPVRPAEWVTEAVTGNAFRQMYDDNLELLRRMARAQTATAEEARWQDFRYLIGLAVEQGSMFLPIPFAVVIGLWQSRQLAGQALAAARNRKWGQALSEMVAAMVNLFSVAAPGPHATPRPETFAWRPGSQLPAELRRRLAAMEVTDRELAQLTPVPSMQLYLDGEQHYASVEGKVFQVGQQAGQWHILDRQNQWGPPIRLGAQNRWQLALGLSGGGPVTSRYRRERVLDTLKDQFVITENGLREIRRFKPSRAIQLEGSLIHAQRILHRALRKLATPGNLAEDVRAVLEDTFGPGQATPALAKRLHGMVDNIYAEAVGTSLRDGERWVLCSPAPGNELNVAFIVNTDPKRRVFLSDAFFDPSVVRAVDPNALRAGFDPLRYLQSAVLIHELSHWSLRTDDLAYLGLSAPYADLIDPSLGGSDRVQIEAECRSLSHDTPSGRLFSMLGGASATNADRSALRRLLALTRQNDLAGAIAAYQADPVIRNEVILSNADSVTWLVLQLGRESVTETAV
ncbi:dermonecrotic toxin domain-containing protein [Pseudomonas typographi]|uniref:dermonecrotic toxin domain-containing protein n=1 Tax=Pseudomonas typographi TaxID=2715964 RepID=UPI00168A0FC3|nr:DUF6543 domain-containing protein [Pseudomonas typographi]MBD1553820.1 hypothetical protein [Pseudomonas typographi]